MLKFLSLATVAALALAQTVELESRQNTLQVRRQAEQSADVFELSQQVSRIMANLNDGVPNDIISRISTDTIARTITVTNAQAAMAASLNAEISAVRYEASTNAATASVAAAAGASALAAMQTAMATQAANMQAAMESQRVAAAATAAMQSQRAAAAAASQAAEASTTLARAMSAMDSTLTLTRTQATSTARAQATAVAGAITSLNSTLVSSLAAVAPIATHAWRGGCNGHRNGGWHWYCLDRTMYDTAAPYFRKSSNTRHTSLRNVFLHINFFSIGTSCNWQYNFLYVNGAVMSSAHGHAFYSSWKDSHVIDTLKIPTGQWVGMQSHAACGHTATHSYGRWANYALTWIGNY